ncbi:MAG: hypothetical protein GY807_21080 [Gammaproteobacteria bacterium]|nr:hypothetical protein [Gammaproteobacteria bacterium]
MPINNALLQMSARGAQPRMADAMARGYTQGNAMLQARQQQETRNALAAAAPMLATGGPQAAFSHLAQAGQFEPAMGLYNAEQDRVHRQDKLNQPKSALGKLWGDELTGRVPRGTTQREIDAIGKGGVNVYTGDNIPLGKKVTSKQVSDVTAGRVALSNISSIRQKLKPDWLTYKGQLVSGATKIAEKAGFGDYLPKESKQKLREYTQFKTAVEQEFNRYRKEITGAAAAIQELQALRKATFNTDQSPTEFNAALDQLESSIRRIDQLRIDLLSKGIDPKTPEGGAQLDAMYLRGGAGEDRGASIGQPADNDPLGIR